MPAHRGIGGERHGEFDGQHECRRGHIAERVVRHVEHVDHHGDASAGPDVDGRAAAGHAGDEVLDRASEPHGVLCDACAKRPACAAHEEHRAQRRLAILGNAVHDQAHGVGHRRLLRLEVGIKHEPLGVLARGRHHQQAHPGPRGLRVDPVDDRQRILDVGAAPAQAWLGHLEVAARRRLAAAHPDAGGFHVEELAGLVLGQHAGDVVVDHDHFVAVVEPLLREDADRGRATAHAHALLALAIDHRRLAGLHDDGGAAIDGEFDRALVGELEHRVAGGVAFLLRPAGQVVHAAKGEHLGAVLRRGHVPDGFAIDAHGRLLGSQPAVGVDLQLEPAVAEDALGHDRHHVHAFGLGRDDEGRGLVVRVSRSRADAGHESVCG